MSSGSIFAVENRADGIVVVRFDLPGETHNVIKTDFIDQASQLFAQFSADQSVTAIVFASAKAGSFIAGADIEMLAACPSADAASALARQGQAFCALIEASAKPVVAAIDGVCLGGGLEFALACQGRVCTCAEHTRFGLPEVQLGLLPGSGGTQRLPERVGVLKALDLMLTGRHVRANEARRIGLVDECVAVNALLAVAIARARELCGTKPRAAHGLADRMVRFSPMRLVAFAQARRRLAAKTFGNYPAPEHIISCVEIGLARGREAGFAAEAQRFGELSQTPQSGELIRLYFATIALRKDCDALAGSPQTVKQIGVLGAGLMGAGISYVSSVQGELLVRFKDRDSAALDRGLKTISRLIQRRLKRGTLTAYQARQQLARISPCIDYRKFDSLDLVVEAVYEDLELKRRMLADIEDHCQSTTIFATNTSSIRVAEIALHARRPEQVIGMHYFSPVEKMPLLEVVVTDSTSAQAVATAAALGRRQGKTVIVVKDGAGFFVNRILAPYINEAAHLLLEGVAIERIDRAMTEFGFPLGPFALLDQVGIDVASKISPLLASAYGARMHAPDAASRLLKADRLGKKSGRGFYLHPKGKKRNARVDKSVYALLDITPSATPTMTEISERCVLPMLNEAAYCLTERVIGAARDGDIGAVFGIGFPPFLGGPFRYIDQMTAHTVVERLEQHKNRLGERFEPAPGLRELALNGHRYYHAPADPPGTTD